MKRGEIWLINLDPTIGAEIRKTRPAVIVNDDALEKTSPENNSAAHRLERHVLTGSMDGPNTTGLPK
jgi:mRNA-degrading endonuclease toxin of MazEF toxin-antitoxin module